MKDFSVSHVNTNGSAFPDTEPIDASGPSTTDGTEYIAAGIGEWWGAFQAILTAAGVTPSGSVETDAASDVLDSLETLFLPENMITGLVISNNITDAVHDIDISTGRAMDSANAVLLRLTSALTKQIDASWVAGSGNGGMFTGAVAADTSYHIFIIKKDSDGSIDAGFDISPSAANIPAGYTEARRIGSVLTDSSANIRPFTSSELAGGQVDFEYKDMTRDINDVSPSTGSKTDAAVSVPDGVEMVGRFITELQEATSSTNAWFASKSFTDVAADGTNRTHLVIAFSVLDSKQQRINTDVSAEISYRADLGTATMRLFTLGFLDRRVS